MGNFPLQETCSLQAFCQLHQRDWASQVALAIRNPPANAGDVRDAGSIAGSGRSPGGGRGDPLRYPGPENPHGQATVHGVGKSQTRLKRLGRHTPTRFTLCGCTTSVWAAGPPPPPETALSSPHPGSGGPGHLPPNHSLWALQAAQCLEPRCQATSQTSSLVLRSPSHTEKPFPQ